MRGPLVGLNDKYYLYKLKQPSMHHLNTPETEGVLVSKRNPVVEHSTILPRSQPLTVHTPLVHKAPTPQSSPISLSPNSTIPVPPPLLLISPNSQGSWSTVSCPSYPEYSSSRTGYSHRPVAAYCNCCCYCCSSFCCQNRCCHSYHGCYCTLHPMGTRPGPACMAGRDLRN